MLFLTAKLYSRSESHIENKIAIYIALTYLIVGNIGMLRRICLHNQ